MAAPTPVVVPPPSQDKSTWSGELFTNGASPVIERIEWRERRGSQLVFLGDSSKEEGRSEGEGRRAERTFFSFHKAMSPTPETLTTLNRT